MDDAVTGLATDSKGELRLIFGSELSVGIGDIHPFSVGDPDIWLHFPCKEEVRVLESPEGYVTNSSRLQFTIDATSFYEDGTPIPVVFRARKDDVNFSILTFFGAAFL